MSRRFLLAAVALGLACALAAGSGAAAAAPSPTQIGVTPLGYGSTDGDILAITKIAGAAGPEIAIGGNFTAYITRDGKAHPAKNFAIINQANGTLIYGGKINSYVRAIATYGGRIYLGGDFTRFGSYPRNHLAQMDSPTHLTGFNPGSADRVRAITANNTGIVYGGDAGTLRKVSATGGLLWARHVGGGSIRALQYGPGGQALYVGGLFASFNGVLRHGLVKVDPRNGAVVGGFDAHLRPNSGVGINGAYDGENVLSIALDAERTGLVLALGGHAPIGAGVANQARKVSQATGATAWRADLVGDGQAIVTVGNTYVVGYHRNTANGSTPYPYFAAQLSGTNGHLLSWDPRITGIQSNADGGNNGVQAAYADPIHGILYLAGAFTTFNGVKAHQSLIAFAYR